MMIAPRLFGRPAGKQILGETKRVAVGLALLTCTLLVELTGWLSVAHS